MKKILSIIIPVYNVEKYIERCLNSILTSRYNEYEIILVDDGSKDNSVMICDEYSKKYNNIRVIHKKNGGASDARNIGTQQANGKYIWYIDSDDYISNNSISCVLDILYTNDCDIVVCQSKKVFEDNKEVDECIYSIDEGLYSSTEFMEKLKQNPKSVIFCPQYYIVNKNFINDNKIYFYKGIIYEDELWIPQLLIKANKIYYSAKNIYYHCMRRESVMHSTDLEKCGYSAYIVSTELFKIYEKSKRRDLEFLRDRCANIFLQSVWKQKNFLKNKKDCQRSIPIKNAYYLKTRLKSIIYLISPKFYIWFHNQIKNILKWKGK